MKRPDDGSEKHPAGRFLIWVVREIAGPHGSRAIERWQRAVPGPKALPSQDWQGRAGTRHHTTPSGKTGSTLTPINADTAIRR
jgi:hypothetical protein